MFLQERDVLSITAPAIVVPSQSPTSMLKPPPPPASPRPGTQSTESDASADDEDNSSENNSPDQGLLPTMTPYQSVNLEDHLDMEEVKKRLTVDNIELDMEEVKKRLTVDNVTIHQQMRHVQNAITAPKDGSEEVAASPRGSDELSAVEPEPPAGNQKHRFSIKNVENHNKMNFDAYVAPVADNSGAESDKADGNTGSRHSGQLSEMDITDDMLQNRSRAKSLYQNRDEDTRNLMHVRDRPGAPCPASPGEIVQRYEALPPGTKLILSGEALGSYGGRWEHSGEDQHGAVWVHVDRPNQRLYVRDCHWCLGKVNSHGYYLADFMMPHSGG